MTPDKSNGYEAIARAFIAARTHAIGPQVVGEWAQSLPQGASILDIGCGDGVPISQALIHAGFIISGIDASESMIATFRARFPESPAECGAVEDSEFFARAFDGVVAWGLIFLLAPDTQKIVIRKVSRSLRPLGKFLFTSPEHACTWLDGMTGLPSISLGREVYRQELAAAGLTLVDERMDEGENHYYFAAKP